METILDVFRSVFFQNRDVLDDEDHHTSSLANHIFLHFHRLFMGFPDFYQGLSLLWPCGVYGTEVKAH